MKTVQKIAFYGAITMPLSQRMQETLKYLAILIPSFLLLQTLVIIMHEFTHSTVAWLLDDIRSPMDIIWGNPVMMTGWDEGVGYKKLFAQGHNLAAAIIGVSPLIMHSLASSIGILLMLQKWMLHKKWLFHAVFWFTIANLMELIAYILMRGFAANGDTGNFNHGMGISPWFLFIIGSLALAGGLYLLCGKVLPRLYAVFAPGNRMLQWTILAVSAFILFFWGSGIRVMVYLYPDPQWAFGLLAFPAFALVIHLFNPAKICNKLGP